MGGVSIVIPMRNEAENIGALIDGIEAALAGEPLREIIVVDDGSTDGAGAVVAGRMAVVPHLRLLRHPVSAGQSAGVHSGVLAARHDLVCTLDGDGQNPPGELPKLIAAYRRGGVGLVAGQREVRQDTWSKRMASRFANRVRGWALADGTRDTGCGLKAFDRDAFLALPYFDHMHRYLPALFGRAGHAVAHVDVAHQARGAGRSNYSNIQRGLVGAVDLLGVMWLIRRKKRAEAVESPQPLGAREPRHG
ncbi:MAG: glycosyltransferase family 2 protein [Gemmobacter sp.]